METKLIVQNGVDVDPLYKNKILLSNYYIGKPLITNASAAFNTGGQLVAGDYFYKVVALCDTFVDLQGDGASQLAAINFSIMATTATTLRWELTNSGTTRMFELFVGNYKVATGSRTGNGVLTFNEVNNSGINGTVNVTYTAQDVDSGNIINLYRNTVIESDEVTDTAAGSDLEMNLGWDAILGNVTSLLLYRGSLTGVYDGYFVLSPTDVAFTDDGTRSFDFDTAIDTTKQIVVERQFLPDGYIAGVWHPCSNRIAWRFAGDHFTNYINCNVVINKPTWIGTTEPHNIYAYNEFMSWL